MEKEYKSRMNAFTLAEALITLGVIGIVAALTLPTLIGNYEEKVIISKLKKFNSVMNQAFLRSVNDNGTPDGWGLGGAFSFTDEILTEKLLPYLKVSKNCGLQGKCFYNDDIYFLNNLRWTNLYNPTGWGQVTFILEDGEMVAMNIIDGNCKSERGTSKHLQNVCAFLYVDVNGKIKPNVFGKDFFSFYMTKYGIIPTGSPDEYLEKHSFTQNCVGENANGMGCTAWLLYNENREYLKCNNLSWSGKHKCSD